MPEEETIACGSRARRQIAFHSGRRIWARRNGARSGRRTWRPVARASNCHWSVQGAASGSKVAPSKTRQAANKAPGKARSHKGPRRANAKSLPGNAHARRNGRSSAKALAQHQGRYCPVTRSAWRGNARHARVRPREESSAHAEASALRCRLSRRGEGSSPRRASRPADL